MGKMSQERKQAAAQKARADELEKRVEELTVEHTATLAALAEASGATPAAAKKAAAAPAKRLAESQAKDIPSASDPAPEESGQS